MYVATRYATKKSSSSNFLRLHSREWGLFLLLGGLHGKWTFLLYKRPVF